MMMSYGKWTAVGSIVAGAVHLRKGAPCQDALFLHESAAIVCVADGHGSDSCPFSKEGSDAAVRVTAEILAEMLPALSIPDNKNIRLPKMIEARWKERIKEIHAEKERQMPAGDEPFPFILYGTTLLALAASEKFVFALQIGDGNILRVDGENTRPVLTEETVGEETESLCLDDAWTYFRTEIIPHTAKPTMFIIATDGYAKSFADSSGFIKAGTDFFKLWQEEGLSHIDECLTEWLTQTTEKGSGDDIAMALLVNEP